MPVTAPPTIAALPSPPDPNNRATFNTLAYPWSVAQQTLATEVGAVAENVYSNAQEAETQAGLATTNGAAQVALAATQASNAATSAADAETAKLAAQDAQAAAEGAVATIPDGTINDAITTLTDTWSSSKISAELTTLDGQKQDELVSGTNIKTFGGVSLLGSGDIAVVDQSEQSMLALDEKASGTGGGAATIGAWADHVINTVKTNTIAGASLASNQITLPAGRYEISAQVVGFWLSGFKARIRNITDSQTLGVGMSTHATAAAVQVSEARAAFTLSASKTIAIQYFAGTSTYGGTLGAPVSSAEAEVYASVLIRKIWSVV